jgi:type I restriction enzyme R subunit
MAFNENSRVKIPALLHLVRLGYNYLPLSEGKWELSTNILPDLFRASIKAINKDLTEEGAQYF